jgi:hypothetical protein
VLPSHVSQPSSLGAIIPRYLTAQDYLGLDCLLGEYARFVGRRRVELDHHLAAPLLTPAPPNRLRLVRRVLDRHYTDRTEATAPPRGVRQALFVARAEEGTPSKAIERVAAELGLSAASSSPSFNTRHDTNAPRAPRRNSPKAASLSARLMSQVRGMSRCSRATHTPFHCSA